MKYLTYFFLLTFFCSCSEKTQNCSSITLNMEASDLFREYVGSKDRYKLFASIDKYKESILCDSTKISSYKGIIEGYLFANKIDSALIYNNLALQISGNDSLFYITQRGSLYNLSKTDDSAKYYHRKSIILKLEKESIKGLSPFEEAEILELLCKLGEKSMATLRFSKIDSINLKEVEYLALKQIVDNCNR